MKRLKHYAGDAHPAVQLPYRCRWARVVDFDPIGVISTCFNTPPATPGVTLIPPAGSVIVPIEAAAMRLDTRDFAPVYGETIYRSRWQDGPTNPDNYFKTIELLGNIEVEYGEAFDDDPGPLRFGQVSSSFQFAINSGTAGNRGALLYLPKSIKALSLEFNAPGGHLISTVLVQPVFNSTASLAALNQGAFSVWEAGAVAFGYYAPVPAVLVNQAVRPTLTPDQSTSGTALFKFSGAPVAGLVLQLLDAGTASDDVANATYTRVFAPVPMLNIVVTDNNANGDLIVCNGHVTCAF